jgi:hypothetical protein
MWMPEQIEMQEFCTVCYIASCFAGLARFWLHLRCRNVEWCDIEIPIMMALIFRPGIATRLPAIGIGRENNPIFRTENHCVKTCSGPIYRSSELLRNSEQRDRGPATILSLISLLPRNGRIVVDFYDIYNIEEVSLSERNMSGFNI